jgi:hypothetical protein
MDVIYIWKENYVTLTDDLMELKKRDRIFAVYMISVGLAAHSLLIAPIVLVPLACIFQIIYLIMIKHKRKWYSYFGFYISGLAVPDMFITFFMSLVVLKMSVSSTIGLSLIGVIVKIFLALR